MHEHCCTSFRHGATYGSTWETTTPSENRLFPLPLWPLISRIILHQTQQQLQVLYLRHFLPYSRTIPVCGTMAKYFRSSLAHARNSIFSSPGPSVRTPATRVSTTETVNTCSVFWHMADVTSQAEYQPVMRGSEGIWVWTTCPHSTVVTQHRVER